MPVRRCIGVSISMFVFCSRCLFACMTLARPVLLGHVAGQSKMPRHEGQAKRPPASINIIFASSTAIAFGRLKSVQTMREEDEDDASLDMTDRSIVAELGRAYRSSSPTPEERLAQRNLDKEVVLSPLSLWCCCIACFGCVFRTRAPCLACRRADEAVSSRSL